MKLTEHLPPERRRDVEARLQGNLMAWLTTACAYAYPTTRPPSVATSQA
jgi:hypothetical protein